MSSVGQTSRGITGRTVRGAVLMLASRFLGTGIAIGATAVLARYVTPEEFGLVAMVMAILAITRVLEEFGLGDAMIQQEVINNDQISSLFWINGVVGFLLTCGFASASPLIADFYGRDDLLLISVGLSPLFMLAGLGAQHRAVMRRAFRFRPLAIAQTSSLGVGAIGGIVAAVQGLGVWAIVIQNLLAAMTLLVGSWIGSGWRPAMVFSFAKVRPMLGYGLNLGASQFLNALTRSLDNILIGRFVGPAAAGAYNRAFQLMMLPGSQLNQPLSSVVVPALSRLQKNPVEYRTLYRGAIEIISSLALPLAVFSGVAAPALVGTLLGPAWNESIPLLRALSPAGLMVSLNIMTGWVYLSLGRTDRQLRWRLVGVSGAIIGMCIGLNWGALGVALGLSMSRVLLRLPAIIYCFHGTFLRLADVTSVIWRSALASLVAGVVTYFADPVEMASVLRLLVQVVIFTGTWLVSMVVVPGGLNRLAAIRMLLANLRNKDVVHG